MMKRALAATAALGLLISQSTAATNGVYIYNDSLHPVFNAAQDGTVPAGFPSTLSATGNFGTATNGWIDTTGYQSIVAMLSGTFVGTVTYEVTNDNTQAAGIVQMGTLVNNGGSSADATADSVPVIRVFPVTARYFRARVSAYTSGSLVESIYLRSAPYVARSIDVGNGSAIQVAETGSATSTFGIAPTVAGSASSGLVLKASAGSLYNAYATSTAAAWLMVFNSTTVPSNGATTAGVASGNMQECIPLAAVGATNFYSAINYQPGPGEVFTVGISAALSSTACGTLTLATTGYLHGSAR